MPRARKRPDWPVRGVLRCEWVATLRVAGRGKYIGVAGSVASPRARDDWTASIWCLPVWALFSSSKILQKFSDFSSHRIFRRIHRVLNIDENKN